MLVEQKLHHYKLDEHHFRQALLQTYVGWTNEGQTKVTSS
jgi:hypothetical protein